MSKQQNNNSFFWLSTFALALGASRHDSFLGITSRTWSSPTNPTGEAPRTPDSSSHTPVSTTSRRILAVNALMASASFVTPHATALTHEMSFSPKRRFIRDGVTLLASITEQKLLAVKRHFLTKCQEGLFLWPTVKELISFTIPLSTFNFRLINSSCSAAVDRVRNSSEKISSSTVETGRSPSGFGSRLNS